MVGITINDQLNLTAPDHLGSGNVTLNTVTKDSVVQRYTPFGFNRNGENTLGFDQTFTGQTDDPGTGLIDYNARHYDPQLGRFTSADPVLDGLNRYTYVRNNPLKYVDPTGKCTTIMGQRVGCDHYEQPSDEDSGESYGDEVLTGSGSSFERVLKRLPRSVSPPSFVDVPEGRFSRPWELVDEIIQANRNSLRQLKFELKAGALRGASGFARFFVAAGVVAAGVDLGTSAKEGSSEFVGAVFRNSAGFLGGAAGVACGPWAPVCSGVLAVGAYEAADAFYDPDDFERGTVVVAESRVIRAIYEPEAFQRGADRVACSKWNPFSRLKSC